ncbi:MAG TPA: DUF4056 domain-containing protein [Sedimentisphaerales bacterium]|nr:DUF4056 domain-containing protein [Sedimentisphaerales bacterium]
MLRLCHSVVLSAIAFALAGCGGGPEPRMRLGCYPTPTVGTAFPDPNALGAHSYAGSDKVGIVYTCRGGHIDLAHLRIAADWSMYLANMSFDNLIKNKKEFSFKSKPAPSMYYVKITYPANWADMRQNERERIAREFSLTLGQYFGYVASTWHEIATWFGYKFVALLPEFSSSFSWEDSYSNLLGTRLAIAAIQDPNGYDRAMTLGIDRELAALGVQSRRIAEWAGEKMRGQWFSGRVVYMVNMKKRNFDIGLGDGYVTPTLVPDLTECWEAQAQAYPVPTLDEAGAHGFSVRLEIEPKIRVKKKILKVAYGDADKRGKRVEPTVHFPRIMDYIKQDAVKRLGPNVSD